MADYDDINDAELASEQPVTTSLMFRLRDNPLAIVEGAPGAPRIQTAAYEDGSVGQAAIASGGVGQDQLKTSTGSVGGTGTHTLPGGAYGFYPRVQRSGSTGDIDAHIASGATNSSFASIISLSSTGAGTVAQAHQTYIQSSPPYDHGDGEILGYAYALLNPDGTVAGTYIAEDPPWYGNTRQSPQSQFVRNGKVYGRFRRPACCLGDLKAGRVSLSKFKARWGQCELVEEEITTASKLRGMEELPHPFFPDAGQTVVLLDPMDDLTGRLIAMTQVGEDVIGLFADDYLRVDNTSINRKGPPVPIHTAKWR